MAQQPQWATAVENLAAQIERLQARVVLLEAEAARASEFRRLRETDIGFLKRRTSIHQKIIWTITGMIAFIGFILPMIGLIITFVRHK